jgi:hypothetical protein
MAALPKARPHNSKGNRRPDDWLGTLYPKHPFRVPVSLCLSANGRDVIASLTSPSRLQISLHFAGEFVAEAGDLGDLFDGGFAEFLDAAEVREEGVLPLGS